MRWRIRPWMRARILYYACTNVYEYVPGCRTRGPAAHLDTQAQHADALCSTCARARGRVCVWERVRVCVWDACGACACACACVLACMRVRTSMV